jgi:hypothetical protein
MKDQNLHARLRSFEIDHKPDGWPAIRMRDVSALLDRIDELEARLEIDHRNPEIDGIYCRDATIKLQDERIASLEAQLVKESARTADEKLRADQMTQRLDMCNRMRMKLEHGRAVA